MPGIIHASGGWKGGNAARGGRGRAAPAAAAAPRRPTLRNCSAAARTGCAAVLPGGGGRRLSPATLIAIIALVVAFAAYFFFTFRVQQNEEGVVLRFGAYNRNAEPGLNFRLPYPIETVYTPEVTTVNRVTIRPGRFAAAAAATSRKRA